MIVYGIGLEISWRGEHPVRNAWCHRKCQEWTILLGSSNKLIKYLKDQKWNVLNYFLVEKSCRGRYGILIDSREAICQHSGVHVLEEWLRLFLITIKFQHPLKKLKSDSYLKNCFHKKYLNSNNYHINITCNISEKPDKLEMTGTC